MDMDRNTSNVEKSERYESLIQEIKSLIDGENDCICIMANVTAAIKEAFSFFWVGFYRVIGDQLVLGPFQGSAACCRIAYGKGVCGMSWKTKETIVVPDVSLFPGHIACSEYSKSEIVVPLINDGKVLSVLDIDSDRIECFDKCDRKNLESIASYVSNYMYNHNV